MISTTNSLKSFSYAAFTLAIVVFCLGLFMLVMGYPAPEWLPKIFGAKSIRKIFQLFIIFSAAGVISHPKRNVWVNTFFENLTNACSGYKGISVLVAIYSILFLWNQITAYLSVTINFLPFSFYDYMLHYFWHGKINFTGMLHWFYHTNNILYVFAPFWFLFKNSLFLVIIYGPLLALGALPLFLLSRRIFPNSWLPLAIAFLYLNFRFLLNLLEMNFLVEAFYPLLIFTALYCFVSDRFKSYVVSIILILLIKEDAPFYVLALGGFLIFFKGKRKFAIISILLAIAYTAFLTQVFLPLTKSNIIAASANNFQDMGSNPKEILVHYLTHPWIFIEKLFWPYAKIKTQLKLLQATLFLPLLSPWYLMVLVSLAPPFCMWNDVNGHFSDLRFHYSAVVIPFLYFAFVTGLKNTSSLIKNPLWREYVLRIAFVVLLLLAGGNYMSHRISDFQFKTITEISKLPPQAVVVTQGHLLPYIGYKKFNMYLCGPYELEGHPYSEIYNNADYYFLARSVNAYPYDKNWINDKIDKLKKNPDLKLIYDDGERVLFKRKTESLRYKEFLDPIHYTGSQHERYSM